MKDYEMPVAPLRTRISLLSVEYGAVDVDGSALVVSDKRGMRAQLPIGATAVLMLEPGTTITHAAIKMCAESRTLVIWTGEGGVRLYSAAQEGAAHTYRLLRQARLALNPSRRLRVAREMYRLRFGGRIPARRSIEQLRGMEGARVRARYKELADEYGVEWKGRNYDRHQWGAQDDLNRAVSAANSCLYGLCHAAVLISGYAAAIGFIHTGHPLAFVYDVADLWKMDVAAPVAFSVVAEGVDHVGMAVRHRLRDAFRAAHVLERIIPTMEQLMDAGEAEGGAPEELGGARLEPFGPEDAPWYRNRNGANSERADAAAGATGDIAESPDRTGGDPTESDSVEGGSDTGRGRSEMPSIDGEDG